MKNILIKEIDLLLLKNDNNYKSKNFKLIENCAFKDFGLEFKNYKNVKDFYKDYLKLEFQII
tara:strand:+ start:46 stop:231 length:186 start_codon:yes stop_codon:yes gene_type:complete